ncbi:DUF2796 domain-containing protein [Rheinheimera mesophila]|uniref:DUF2796 domain-containing protein n=1 Tax=Rheinheimera mesophila TaxID=1547515 RepID=A0A3P3QJ62_9GAMM|nr:DUF2796 domain-containing protein [Rheinheimera mesophila]KKL01331.1 hypothetical protein SD53_10565 [Rheinheimera mesophila]RRJ21214.1 DUF2796 domain-containing protein [Rheinheimera mesophila]
MRLAFLLASGTLLLSQSIDSLAQQPDTRAHEHGVARLELFTQATELHISFYATGADLLGFEHHPQNQTEIDTVQKTITLLAKADQLFQIEGTSCSLKQHKSSLAEPQQPREAEHHHEHEHSGHTDIEVSYQYSCTTTAAPLRVKVLLFGLFPGLQKINSSWITEQGQSAATLSPKVSQLTLN